MIDDAHFRRMLIFLFYSSIVLAVSSTSSQEAKAESPTVVTQPQSEIISKKDDKTEASVDWKFISDLLLKIFNIGVIIYIFRNGRTERREDVQRKKYYFWFQDLLIKGGKPHIDAFFLELDKLCEEHFIAVKTCAADQSTTITEYQKQITDTHVRFNKSKRELDKQFVSFMYIVTPQLGEQLDQLLSDLQDGFGERIHVATTAYNLGAMESLIANFKKNFLLSLFSWKPDL